MSGRWREQSFIAFINSEKPAEAKVVVVVVVAEGGRDRCHRRRHHTRTHTYPHGLLMVPAIL